jgi:hypothetical protein
MAKGRTAKHKSSTSSTPRRNASLSLNSKSIRPTGGSRTPVSAHQHAPPPAFDDLLSDEEDEPDGYNSNDDDDFEYSRSANLSSTTNGVTKRRRPTLSDDSDEEEEEEEEQEEEEEGVQRDNDGFKTSTYDSDDEDAFVDSAPGTLKINVKAFRAFTLAMPKGTVLTSRSTLIFITKRLKRSCYAFRTTGKHSTTFNSILYCVLAGLRRILVGEDRFDPKTWKQMKASVMIMLKSNDVPYGSRFPFPIYQSDASYILSVYPQGANSFVPLSAYINLYFIGSRADSASKLCVRDFGQGTALPQTRSQQFGCTVGLRGVKGHRVGNVFRKPIIGYMNPTPT